MKVQHLNQNASPSKQGTLWQCYYNVAIWFLPNDNIVATLPQGAWFVGIFLANKDFCHVYFYAICVVMQNQQTLRFGLAYVLLKLTNITGNDDEYHDVLS